MRVLLYSKEQCCLCENTKAMLQELQQEFSFQIEEVDIYKDDALLERYQIMIPVVEIEGEEVAFGIISKNSIKKALNKILRC